MTKAGTPSFLGRIIEQETEVLFRDYESAWRGTDAAWWYGENTLSGIVAQAWSNSVKTPGRLGLLEYGVFPRGTPCNEWPKSSGPLKRADLILAEHRDAKHDGYIIENKVRWCRMAPTKHAFDDEESLEREAQKKGVSLVKHLQGGLMTAGRQLSGYESHGNIRMVLCFAIPFISAEKCDEEHASELIEMAIENAVEQWDGTYSRNSSYCWSYMADEPIVSLKNSIFRGFAACLARQGDFTVAG